MTNPGNFNVAIEAVIVKDGKVLITQRSLNRPHAPGEWEILTGRVNQGETFEQAVAREVKEEVDLIVEVLQPFNTFHFYRGEEKIEHLGVSFLCRYKEGDVKVDGEEQIAYKWALIDEAKELIKDQSILNSLEIARNLIQ